MIKIICLSYLLILHFSIAGFVSKGGYNYFLGLIPIYNLYILFNLLDIPFYVFFILSLLIVFLPERMFIITALIVFLPFLIGEYYEEKMIYSFCMLIIPYVFYPYVAYYHGIYNCGGDIWNSLKNMLL